MKYVISTTLATLIFGFVFAQKEGKFSVYFSLDNCEPTDQVRNIMRELNDGDMVAVSVIGYTDYLGSNDYNARLAKCRAEKIANELKTQLGNRLEELSVRGEGEVFSEVQNPEGVPRHRRVDVLYTIIEANTANLISEEENAKPVKETTEELITPEEELIEIDTNKGKNIVLEGLLFIPGRHYPLPQSGPVLEKLLRTMKANPTLEIEIQGFICCDYTVEDGYDNDTGEPKLSHNRAKFVYDYLKTGGISAARMRYKGYGSTRPKVFPENSPEDEQTNRRVEIEILKY